MLLNEYQWSRNPRGMHNRADTQRMDLQKLIEMRMGWAKLVVLGPDYLDLIDQLLQLNITPIVRIFSPRFGAAPATGEMWNIWRTYYARGVRWFEFYNEPNLGDEWPMGFRQSYRDIPNVIAPLMQNWLIWAEGIVEMGGYPAFPALAEAVGSDFDVTNWLRVMMTYLADNFYDRFRAVANNGLWCATHPYIYNHYYQEGSGPVSARSPYDQRAWEGGWRFEYPYDPITQASKPGITAVSGPADAPLGDPVGLIGMGMAFMTRFQEMFGGGAIPVVGTEGGITPVPRTDGDFHQIDSRFPGYNWGSHGEATVAMFDWIASNPNCPPWMFGVALWKEDDYLYSPSGPVHAVKRLSETAAPTKEVPPIGPLDGLGWGPGGVAGPGPIHGTPDYHFLLITPEFNAEWFFQSGKAYWERFKPALLTSSDYIGNLNYKKSLGLTILAPTQRATFYEQEIKGRYPRVWVDMIATDTPDSLAKILAERATTGRRFG